MGDIDPPNSSACASPEAVGDIDEPISPAPGGLVTPPVGEPKPLSKPGLSSSLAKPL